MKLENQSQEFRKSFLLAFTRELIRHSIPEEVAQLQAQDELKKKHIRKEVKETFNKYKKSPEVQLKKVISPMQVPLKVPKVYKPLRAPRRLIIPRPRFPQRLQYIHPVPSNVQIDLGKLNPLIQDSAVREIICNGSDEPVSVRVSQERKTRINLTKDEIDGIIQAFSNASKIPVHEGIYRVAVGRLILSAIVSDIVGSKFIISKMKVPNISVSRTY